MELHALAVTLYISDGTYICSTILTDCCQIGKEQLFLLVKQIVTHFLAMDLATLGFLCSETFTNNESLNVCKLDQ